ncbi:MAG: PEP-CTERM sorting domain-containing protein, partial [Verrucomicrobiota bacterium]
ESEAAGQAFSSIVKEGVGKWIIGSSGDAVNTDANVTVNAGTLGFTAGALGGVSHTGTVTLADLSTLRWESGNTDDVSSRLRAAAPGAGITLDFAGGATTFAGALNVGTANVTKSGSGALTLAGANTMTSFTVEGGSVNVTNAAGLGTGVVAVNGGTLSVNAAVSNVIDVGNGGTLGGVGSVSLGTVTVDNGGAVAPGNSPGILSGTNMTLIGGATFIWEVRNRTLAAGTGYDFLSLSGNLNLSGASSSNRIILKIVSLNASNAIDNAENFANNVINGGYVANFNFANVGSLNLGANANINDVFDIDTSDFHHTNRSSSAAGLWSLSYDGSGGITLTAVPEPSTYGFGLGALALAAAAIRRRRKNAPKA